MQLFTNRRHVETQWIRLCTSFLFQSDLSNSVRLYSQLVVEVRHWNLTMKKNNSCKYFLLANCKEPKKTFLVGELVLKT
jgi:hypothetical protein